MKVAIIGTGLIGSERIEAVKHISEQIDNDVYISSCFDTNHQLLLKTKDKYNVPISSNIEELLEDKPDWVFISVPNNVVFDVAKKAFLANCNVLVEKPFGRTLEECNRIISLKPENCKLHVGFNYRFFRGIEAALQDARDGKFGKLISVNFILAHGNAPGMEKSWKLDPECCGSVAADLSVHLFDLILQLSPKSKVDVKYAQSWQGVWGTGIEEETHIMLSNDEGTIFNTQVSLDRWRSTFKIEINGTEGYGVVDGRGRSYGPQSYKTGVKWGWHKQNKFQAETEVLCVNKNDCTDSFRKETIAVLKNTNVACDHIQAINIMKLLDQYQNIIK